MGKQYYEITDDVKRFIEKQKMFFVGTAAAEGKINVSPKGMDSLRVLNANRVIWLNVTGSGNETSAHVQQNKRMTIMFCAFEGAPMILRLYGDARVIHHNDDEWVDLYSRFDPLPGARQIFDLDIELVQTSCGMSVPFFDYQGEREELNDWAKGKGPEGIEDYWREKNQTSLDNAPTRIVELNLSTE